MGMYNNFNSYVDETIKINGFSDLEQYVKYCTDTLFNLKNNTINSEIAEVNHSKLVPRRFYLIRYNYNGNLIWCPIMALDYKVIKNKNILYAINLEYLPPKYKKLYFDKIFNGVYSELNKIAETGFDTISQEPLLPYDFEFIYKTLKANGGMNYVVTAYDYLKIKEIFLISIKIAPEIIFCDPKKYNSASMKEMFDNLEQSDEKDKLGDIIDELEEIIETYQIDSIEYHKRVALFEKHLKLIK